MPVLNPVSLGIVMPRDEKGLKGFAHLWSVIGYALGTEEQFILCKDTRADNDWGECKRHLRDIFLKHLLPQLMNLDFEGEIMIESMLLGVTSQFSIYPLEGMLINLLEEHLGVRATHVRKQSGFLPLVIGTTANEFLLRFSRYFPVIRRFSLKFGTAAMHLASLNVFGDPGTNSTVVSTRHFYF
ncbi:unnamed protein product [Allacma fusca]|uniref:Uncharacterized protein n=1 Tax=Allacma fusca TaxID=39272 RepID=A0A8J2L385_9HEXA|nr:unnamed protein product [Allacma fusca]